MFTIVFKTERKPITIDNVKRFVLLEDYIIIEFNDHNAPIVRISDVKEIQVSK